ncbi:hypothetical protein KH5H1_15940 [Corallococcus caeni]|nr:hypothetical protein KH5H1_15940 [Corallococcus sp. KH5-1]
MEAGVDAGKPFGAEVRGAVPVPVDRAGGGSWRSDGKAVTSNEPLGWCRGRGSLMHFPTQCGAGPSTMNTAVSTILWGVGIRIA